jgi:hypothetical protein
MTDPNDATRIERLAQAAHEFAKITHQGRDVLSVCRYIASNNLREHLGVPDLIFGGLIFNICNS